MNRPSLNQRLRYEFDRWMSRGTVAIMGLLGLTTIAFVLVLAALAIVLRAFPDDAEEGDFWDIAWGNLMRTLDPGTMGGDQGWGFRSLMLVVTVGGLVMVASLIGIVSGAFDSKMLQLRKGRSVVLERDHTLILGWSPQIYLLISEICSANESRKRAAIVVLADRDKVEMEDAIREHVPNPGRTEIICRSGDPMSPADLAIANPLAARSVVILTSEHDDPDAAAIKTAMALTHALPEDGPGARIVATLRDPDNLSAARLAARDNARWLLGDSLIRRLTAQTCRQSGLSTVYADLLDFAGDEIYFTRQPDLAGSTYAQTQHAFADSTVIGLARVDGVLINPAPDEVVQADDELIVIAGDDSEIHRASPGEPDRSAIADGAAPPLGPERTLVLGYHAGVRDMLTELAHYVPPGSSVDVVTDDPELTVDAPAGLEVVVHRADITNRRVLESLDVDRYDHIVVMTDPGLGSVHSADARTMVVLLHLRDIADRDGLHLNIVSEMLDDRNRELAEVTRADDFIVSDRLVALMLAQVSENPRLDDVFATLFASEGSEVYLRPAELYVRPEVEIDFHTVVAAAAARGETAIGYRVGAAARSREQAYGVHLNPSKSARFRLGAGDSVIVLAEEA